MNIPAWCNKGLLLLWCGLGVLLFTLFWLFPEVDLTVSGWFYDVKSGFIYASDSRIRFVYELMPWLVGLYVTFSIGLIMMLFYTKRESFCGITREAAIFLLAVMILGPGILVHNVVKEIADRPRPRNIVQFGGEMEYVPPFTIGERGNAFVSGHVASATCFFALFFVMYGVKRTVLAILAVILVVATACARVMQGGHFLSDVIIAIWLTLCVMMVCALFVKRNS